MIETIFGPDQDSSKLSLTFAEFEPFTEERIAKVAERVQELAPAVSNAIRIQSSFWWW